MLACDLLSMHLDTLWMLYVACIAKRYNESFCGIHEKNNIRQFDIEWDHVEKDGTRPTNQQFFTAMLSRRLFKRAQNNWNIITSFEIRCT